MFDKGMLELTEYDDCVEFLSSVGCDKFEIENIERTIIDHACSSNRDGAIEGLIGDDLWEFENDIHNATDELSEIADLLDKPSRKGNTRADLAKALNTVIANINAFADYCIIYKKNEI